MDSLTPFICSFLDTHELSLKPPRESSHFNIESLRGDASTRRYYRVTCEGRSWILQEWEDPDDSSFKPFLSIQKHWIENSIGVVKVVSTDESRGLILMEDLGDQTLEKCFWGSGKTELFLDFYKKALDELILIQSLIFKNPQKKSCTAYQVEFSVKKFLDELNFTKKHFFEIFLKVTPDKKTDYRLDQIFINLCESLYKSPQVVCHKDYHSRNMMIRDDQMAIIDFQDALLAPPVYDLVSLFKDSYIHLDTGHIEILMNYYLENFPHFSDLNMDKEEFYNYFDLQVIQRCFKVCGTFSGFKNIKNDQRYLKYIPETANHVVEFLKKKPDYAPLLEIMEETKSQWKDL